MSSPILLCTDGSDEALSALAAGLELLGREHHLVLVTVMDGPDEGALVGSGHAGAELTADEFDAQVAQADRTANTAVEEAGRKLAIADADVRICKATRVRRSASWPRICPLGPSWSDPGDGAG